MLAGCRTSGNRESGNWRSVRLERSGFCFMVAVSRLLFNGSYVSSVNQLYYYQNFLLVVRWD